MSSYAWVYALFAFLLCLAIVGFIVCLICFCIGSRFAWRRTRSESTRAALPDNFRPDHTGHLYSHVIFADRTYQARMSERQSRFSSQRARTELSAPHVSQLHPSYLPPPYNDIVSDGVGGAESDEELPPNYAVAVASTSV